MELSSYITEGIVFFKESKKLYKIANKIEQNSTVSIPEIDIIVSKLRAIGKMFEEVEKKYKENPKEAKIEYEVLKKKYMDFISLINNASFNKSLKVLGSLGIISAGILAGYAGLEAVKGRLNTVNDAKVTSVINGLTIGGTAATAVGVTEFFKKIFASDADELFDKTRRALFTLEKVEQIKKIDKIGANNV